jgi:hypothetical protein
VAGKIFINYRRDDSIGMAGRLHDRLAHTFGRAKLFMDVDHIPVGTDFVAHLNSQVAVCDVILVIIGPNWLGVKDESGGRRLDDPDDFVAIEIAAALARAERLSATYVFFDKDRGAEIFVRAAGGTYLTLRNGVPTGCAPLKALELTPANHSFLGELVRKLVTPENRPLTRRGSPTYSRSRRTAAANLE